jgi:DNA-binding GntR family transcriptional regulator
MADAILPAGTQRRTVAEEVYRALKRDIITLRHRPGASLTEKELAELYGSSRVPVREACRRLQQEDLVTAVPYKGYFVNQISLKDIGDCFDLRLALEIHAVKAAVARATDADLDRLARLAATEYTFHDWVSYTQFLERNEDFHIQLAALSGNQRLVSVLRDLIGTMQRFFLLGLDLGDFASEMRGEHEQLVSLLQRGDGDGAVTSMKQQIAASRRRILQALIDDEIDLPLE